MNYSARVLEMGRMARKTGLVRKLVVYTTDDLEVTLIVKATTPHGSSLVGSPPHKARTLAPKRFLGT